jgi:hypothetical protein
MRTAIDTNALSALWSKEPLASERKTSAMAKIEGGLVEGAPVYAELLAYPKATESFVNSFLGDTGIDVDFEFQQRVWLEAGEEPPNKGRGVCLPISSLDRMPWRRRIVS